MNPYDGKPCVLCVEETPEYGVYLSFAIKKPIKLRTAKYLMSLFHKAAYAAADAVREDDEKKDAAK